MRNSDINDELFRDAVEAIDTGNAETLKKLLQQHPQLTTKRLDTPNEQGYFKNPYLLWFVADNPIRHDKLPANIVEVTNIIVKSLQKQHDANYQQIMDYTLGLVATGRIPKQSGVQIPLMKFLISEGARVRANVLGAIGEQNFEAAKFLLDNGADYNLATAVAFDNIQDAKKLAGNATASELFVALVVASFFGKATMISLLIEKGADVNGTGTPEDFGGFHSHASPLHQAVYSGSLECVQLLVNAGADVNASDKVYNGTPLGWAKYGRGEAANNEEEKKKFAEIELFLTDHSS